MTTQKIGPREAELRRMREAKPNPWALNAGTEASRKRPKWRKQLATLKGAKNKRGHK